MSNVTNYLTPEEINAYQSRIDNADIGSQRALFKLGNRRQEATADFNTARGRLGTQWDNYQRTLPNQFARRNILRSGLMGRAINEYDMNRRNADFDLERSYTRQMGGLSENQGDIELMLNMNRTQVDRDRNARQQALASQLQAVQQ
jgi:phospholipase/lecithinase/hemolysin